MRVGQGPGQGMDGFVKGGTTGKEQFKSMTGHRSHQGLGAAETPGGVG